MFLVNEHPQYREQTIRSYLQKDPSVAVLVAAAHFEWTICRAIVFLSKTPNAELRKRMKGVSGLGRYEQFWLKEVSPHLDGRTLRQVVANWSEVDAAFKWRHELIHGRDRCTRNMATPKVEAMLRGAEFIRDCCTTCGVDFRRRLPVRRTSKPSESRPFPDTRAVGAMGRSRHIEPAVGSESSVPRQP